MKRIRSHVQNLTAYVPGEQPRDPDLVKLNTNENPWPPSPRVAEALLDLDPARLRLYPDPVCHELRATIAELHGCSPAQVFVGNGSDEVLALCVRAFVERDGTVGWFDPSYSLYPVLAAIEGLATKPVPLPADFSWTMPEGYDASLFFLTHPNAPTSLLYPLDRIRTFCRHFPGVVLLDEAYVDFAPEHGMGLALALDNVLVARSLSKSYSLAGIRLGYAVGPERLIAALYKIKDSYNVSYLTQVMGLAALRDQDWMKANVRRVVATREHAALELRRRGFEVFASATNFLWAKPPAGRDAPVLFESLRARKIFVRYFPGDRTGAYLRITVGTEEQMARLFHVLDDLFKA